MALSQTKTLKGSTNIVVNDVAIPTGEQTVSKDYYIKVETANCTKTTCTAAVKFDSKDDYTYRKNYSYSMDLSGENAIKQAYVHLKTLDEFKDAKDV